MKNPTVKLFDPSRDPSVAGQLRAKRLVDPTVTGLKTVAVVGLVETPQGTYWLDTDGFGGIKPLEVRPCEIEFAWTGEQNTVSRPMIARFTLDECRACLTGETRSLHEFLGGKLDQIQKWEAILP